MISSFGFFCCWDNYSTGYAKRDRSFAEGGGFEILNKYMRKKLINSLQNPK